MHYPDLGSDASSVWNLSACFSDLIWQKTSHGVAKCHLSLLTMGFLFIASLFGSVSGGDFMYNFRFVL